MHGLMRTALAGIAILAAAGPAAAAVVPKPEIPGAERVSIAIRDLDRQGAAEQIWVYNLPQGAARLPETRLTVWRHIRGRGWTKAFGRRVYGPGPGNPQSGLVQAMVGELNRDGHVEVMVRNDVTASVGEVLVILRQSTPRSLSFRVLQRITGDEVTVRREPPGGTGGARITSRILANHSPDDRAHAEQWLWSSRAGQWVCSADCRGSTQAGVFADPEQAAASGLSGLTVPTRVISVVRRDLLPGDTRDPATTRLYAVTFELLRATPVLPAGVHTQFAYVVRSGSGWRLESIGTGP